MLLIRGTAAIVWAAAFATVSNSITTTSVVLLVLYPVIDLIASAATARQQYGSTGLLLEINASVGWVAATALGIGAAADPAKLICVLGLWAVVTGGMQLVLAIRRPAALGDTWPMVTAGALSIISGIAFAAMAATDAPRLGVVALYAAGAGTLFVIQARLLANAQRRTVHAANPTAPDRAPGVLLT
jgi:hypothetical protein